MTTYAPTFTPRYRVHYQAAGVEHTVQIRGPRGESGGGLTARGSNIQTLFFQLKALLADDFEWLFAEYALTDSDVFVPTTVPSTVTGEVAVADFTIRDRITGTTFSGKASGSKARLTIFGIQWPEGIASESGNDFKVTGGEYAGVATAVSACTSFFYAGSGSPAVFHNQVTIKENDHLVKKARQGLIS